MDAPGAEERPVTNSVHHACGDGALRAQEDALDTAESLRALDAARSGIVSWDGRIEDDRAHRMLDHLRMIEDMVLEIVERPENIGYGFKPSLNRNGTLSTPAYPGHRGENVNVASKEEVEFVRRSDGARISATGIGTALMKYVDRTHVRTLHCRGVVVPESAVRRVVQHRFGDRPILLLRDVRIAVHAIERIIARDRVILQADMNALAATAYEAVMPPSECGVPPGNAAAPPLPGDGIGLASPWTRAHRIVDMEIEQGERRPTGHWALRNETVFTRFSVMNATIAIGPSHLYDVPRLENPIERLRRTARDGEVHELAVAWGACPKEDEA
jgi:hypothetical protein